MQNWLLLKKGSAALNKSVSQSVIEVLDFYVMLTVHLSIILDNDQLDTRLLYFTIRLL